MQTNVVIDAPANQKSGDDRRSEGLLGAPSLRVRKGKKGRHTENSCIVCGSLGDSSGVSGAPAIDTLLTYEALESLRAACRIPARGE